MKKCKGINKAHGFEGCGNLSNYRKHGLCPSCLYEWMTTNDNGKIYHKKQFLPKVKKAENQRKRETKKKQYESLKSIARLIQDARRPFQKWIRQRDSELSCISCGDSNAKNYHAGHYLKAELYTGLIFNEINVNKQCEKCNTYGGGNESGYRIGLVKKYSEEVVKELEELSNKLRSYKFSRDELIDIKIMYNERNKTR